MSYRDNEVYKIMVSIAEMAGITTEYVSGSDIPGCLGQTELHTIKMRNDKPYESDDQACIIYGHELGHAIIERETRYDDPIRSTIEEAQCDIFGAFMYELAYKIYEHQVLIDN